MLAIGSVTGALLAARRERPRIRVVLLSSAAFGLSCALSAFMPSYETFAISLVLVGFTAITLMTTANGAVQTTTSPVMRGRVMALYMAIFLGGTPIGAPVIGWVANEFGPRWALGVGAMSGVLAALVGGVWLMLAHKVRVRYDPSRKRRFRVISGRDARARAEAELALEEGFARRS